MNEELKPREEELLRATARLSADESLAAEANELRAGFLQFGELLDRAAGEFDEVALLAKLKLDCAEDVAPQPAAVTKPQRPWLLPASISGGVVAAAILFLLFQNLLNFELPPGEQAPGIAKNPTIVTPEPGVSLTHVVPWYDIVDDRLTVAQIRVLEADHLPLRASPYSVLEDRVRAVRMELDWSSL